MIETERLRLRQPVASDFEPFAAMFTDPGVTAHIGGALGRSQAWAKFLRDVGHWTLEGFGQFVIVEKGSGAFVGKVGFARFERDLGDRATTDVECSWTLGSAFHGRGYAGEAARAAHDWHDAQMPGPAACLIAEANVASQRLAASLGYREIDRLDRPEADTILLERAG